MIIVIQFYKLNKYLFPCQNQHEILYQILLQHKKWLGFTVNVHCYLTHNCKDKYFKLISKKIVGNFLLVHKKPIRLAIFSMYSWYRSNQILTQRV